MYLPDDDSPAAVAARQQAHIAEAASRKTQTMFKPGTGDDNDPQHLFEQSTHALTGEWLRDIAPCLGAVRLVLKGTGTPNANQQMPLYSTWEREFYASVAKQFEQGVADGRARPLSGKQLVVLKNMLNKLAASTAQNLENDDGK